MCNIWRGGVTGIWLPGPSLVCFSSPSLVNKDWKFWSSLVSEQEAAHDTRLLVLPHWSSYPQRPKVLCRHKAKCCSGRSVRWSPAVQADSSAERVIPWTKTGAMRETRRAVMQDARRDYTKEIKLFILMLLGWWGWVVTDTMGGEVTYIPCQGIQLINPILKKHLFFLRSPFCILEEKMRRRRMTKALGRYKAPLCLRRRNSSVSPWPDCGCCSDLGLGTLCPCDTEHGGFFLKRYSSFNRVVQRILGKFLNNCTCFINLPAELFTIHHHHHLIFVSAQKVQGATWPLNTLSLRLFEIRAGFAQAAAGSFPGCRACILNVHTASEFSPASHPTHPIHPHGVFFLNQESFRESKEVGNFLT